MNAIATVSTETKELVNYSQQINEAHQACQDAHRSYQDATKACQDAKVLGGAKAHECGTWLLKQKEALPYGEFGKWVSAHCQFRPDQASRYIAIANMDLPRVAKLSLRGALYEVAKERAMEAERVERDSHEGRVNYSKQINEAHRAYQNAMIGYGENAHECGTWLLKIKEELTPKQWQQYLTEDCTFSLKIAYRYMAIARLDIELVRQASKHGVLNKLIDSEI